MTKDRANFTTTRTRTTSEVREYHQFSLPPSAIDRFNSVCLALSPGHPLTGRAKVEIFGLAVETFVAIWPGYRFRTPPRRPKTASQLLGWLLSSMITA
jgi:hypothetical protein